MKLERPRLKLRKMFLSILKSLIFSLTLLVLFRYKIAIMNETICPITVAIAPPLTPILKVKMNIGSRTILIIAPTTSKIME